MVQKSVSKSNRRVGKKYRKIQKVRRLKKEHRTTYKASRQGKKR